MANPWFGSAFAKVVKILVKIPLLAKDGALLSLLSLAAELGLVTLETIRNWSQTKTLEQIRHDVRGLFRDAASLKQASLDIARAENIAVDEWDDELVYKVWYEVLCSKCSNLNEQVAVVQRLVERSEDLQQRILAVILNKTSGLERKLELSAQQIAELTDLSRQTHDRQMEQLRRMESHPRLHLPLYAYVPEVSEANSLYYGYQRVSFVGREMEMREFREFLAPSGGPHDFRWWLRTGPGGMGKSRAALELCLLAHRDGWVAGFWDKSDDFHDWEKWEVNRPTLVVVDYVAARADEVREAIIRLYQHPENMRVPVRFLLLERTADEQSDEWWKRFNRRDSMTEHQALNGPRYALPRHVAQLGDDAVWSIMTEIFAERDYAAPPRDETLTLFKTIDPQVRPLFAACAADAIARQGGLDHIRHWNTADLVRDILSREIDQWKIQHQIDNQHVNLLVCATILGGIERDAVESLAKAGLPVPHSAREVNRQWYRRMSGFVDRGNSSDSTVLPPLEPDILGEFLVLERLHGELLLCEEPEYVKADTRQILLELWRDDPQTTANFLVRTVPDFADHPAVPILFDRDLAEIHPGEFALVVAACIDSLSKKCEKDFTDGLLAQVRKVFELYPHDQQVQLCAPGAFIIRGRYYRQIGDPNGAMADYTQVIDMPDAPAGLKAQALVNRGNFKDQQGDPAGAMADYTQVIDMPDAPAEWKAQALVVRGIFKRRQGDATGAVADYTQVIEMPDAPAEWKAQALVIRGIFKGQQGDAAGAVANFTQVIEMPDAPAEQKAQAIFIRGVVKGRQGDAAGAVADYTQVIEMPDAAAERKAKALFHRGVVKDRQGDPAGAMDDYTQVIEMPDTPTELKALALLGRGVVKVQQGDPTGAMADFTQVIEMPDAPAVLKAHALYYRGGFNGQQGDPAGAMADYTQVIDLPDAPAEQKAKAFGRIGWHLLVLERFGDSVDASRRALEIDPALNYVRANLGLALLQLGQIADALDAYRAVIDSTNSVKDLQRHVFDDLKVAVEKQPALPGAREVLTLAKKRYQQLTPILKSPPAGAKQLG